MVKRWIDAGDIRTIELNKEDRKYERLMQEIPNFNKKEDRIIKNRRKSNKRR